jgi:hypothetical protein
MQWHGPTGLTLWGMLNSNVWLPALGAAAEAQTECCANYWTLWGMLNSNAWLPALGAAAEAQTQCCANYWTPPRHAE